MYEDQTYDIILERMMNRVSDKIDKRPSSPVYDLHSSTAIEFQILYIELEYLIKNSYGDTAAREFLILLAKDRGLSPEPATKAILQGEFTPTNIDVTGKRFNIGEINYVVTEQITPGTYKVQCETEGVVGNQYLGDMIPMEYIDGLQTASLTSVLIPGEDEEDTEVFRQRYFDSFNEQSFGGNHADYMAKVKGIEGVGSCKVKRVWNGDIRPADMIVSTVVKNWYESRKVVKSMKEYGKVRSTKQPEQKVIDDYSVWIAENITPVTEAGTDEQPGFTGYEYDLTQYTKDEYIKMIDDRNASLEDQMTQAQEAMCEIYEMMA